MFIIFLGFLSYIIFILYDINQIKNNIGFIKSFFAIGLFLLVLATIILIITPYESDYEVSRLTMAVFMVFSIINFILLIYTLFFAIPFKKAYVEGNKQNLCTEGIYSLSRHPGVLFLFLFYIFLGIALGKPFVIFVGIIFSFFNLIYVFLQDRYFFPVSFSEYDKYREKTGFVLPTIKSIKECIRYYKQF